MTREPIWLAAFLVYYEKTECRIKPAAELTPVARSVVYEAMRRPEIASRLDEIRQRVIDSKRRRAEYRARAA